VGPYAVFKQDPKINNLSLMMTRSIGDRSHSNAVIPDPEFKNILVGPNEKVRFVLASDGMWRVFNNKMVKKTMRKIEKPSVASNRLCLESVWRTQRHTFMKLDDVTVIVVDVYGAQCEQN